MLRPIWLFLLATITSASAQSLTAILQTRSDLSSWLELLKPHWEELDSYNNITFLAPNNAAVTAYFDTPQISGCASTNSTILRALAQYHVLQQEYTSFSSYGAFRTELTDSRYHDEDFDSAYIATATSALGLFDDTDVLISGLNTNSTLVGEPITFDKGIIHVINSVLQLPRATTPTLIAAGYTAAAAAFTVTDLGSIIDGNLDACVLIPTNEAFQRVGESLLQLQESDFEAVMRYHIFNCSILSAGILPDTIQTLQGSNITLFNVSGTPTYVNNAVENDDVAIFSTTTSTMWEINQVLNPFNTSISRNTTAWLDTARVNFIPFESVLPNATPIPLCQRSSSSDSSTNNTALTTNAIIGGVLGGIAGLFLLSLALWFLVKRNRRTFSSDEQLFLEKSEMGDSTTVTTTTTSNSPLSPDGGAELGISGGKHELDVRPDLHHELDVQNGSDRHELTVKNNLRHELVGSPIDVTTEGVVPIEKE